jgi:hypothetical protein
MRILIGLGLGTIIGGTLGFIIGKMCCPGSPIPVTDLDSALSFLFQIGGGGIGAISGFIIGGGLSSSKIGKK